MTTLPLKRLLTGLAVLASFIPGLALADPTCVYVMGSVNGHTVTTPAVTVVVPDSSALTNPITVHLDSTTQTILGYSVTVPGANGGTTGSPVFVPGISQTVPSVSATIPDLNLGPNRCVDVNGATVPAVPVNIPASVITTPGAVADVGTIIINILGRSITTPGEVITFDGKTIIIPEKDAATPTVPVGTPSQTIIVDINGTLFAARYLPPNQ